MRETVGPEMGVKAAGGARSYADALAFCRSRATRIGTSAGVAILKENWLMATTELIELAIGNQQESLCALFSFSSRSCFSGQKMVALIQVSILRMLAIL